MKSIYILLILSQQRVLEHCDDANTQQIIMDEIMQHVCNLAQDQYGNYVIQVLKIQVFSQNATWFLIKPSFSLVIYVLTFVLILSFSVVACP